LTNIDVQWVESRSGKSQDFGKRLVAGQGTCSSGIEGLRDRIVKIRCPAIPEF
jgi:hypothetical protein